MKCSRYVNVGRMYVTLNINPLEQGFLTTRGYSPLGGMEGLQGGMEGPEKVILHKTSKLYKGNKGAMAEVLIIYGGMAAKRLRTPAA